MRHVRALAFIAVLQSILTKTDKKTFTNRQTINNKNIQKDRHSHLQTDKQIFMETYRNKEPTNTHSKKWYTNEHNDKIPTLKQTNNQRNKHTFVE